MVSDKIGLKLHDRFTRGLALSDSEKQTLESWYVQKDSAEQIQILETCDRHSVEKTLRQSIAEAHKQPAYLTERLQMVEEKNERLREKLEAAIALQMA